MNAALKMHKLRNSHYREGSTLSSEVPSFQEEVNMCVRGAEFIALRDVVLILQSVTQLWDSPNLTTCHTESKSNNRSYLIRSTTLLTELVQVAIVHDQLQEQRIKFCHIRK